MNFTEFLNSDYSRSLFIAEAGINHDGSLEKAKRLVDIAKEAGADYVKFQSFDAKKLVTSNALTSTYIDAGSNPGESFRSLLTRLQLSDSDHVELLSYCRESGINFLSTAFDEESFDNLVDLGIDVVKVASGDLTNIPLLKHMSQSRLPIILSTGMATLGEIEDALNALNKLGDNKIFLMHCVSWYPASVDSINLLYIETLKKAFGLPVGFSDHTIGQSASLAARALGAVFFEKHFTVNVNDFGPDHSASIDPEGLKFLIESIREVESALGTSVRTYTSEEWGQRLVHRKSVVATREILSGQKITADMLTLKRPGTGIPPKYIDALVGSTVCQSCGADEVLTWQHFGLKEKLS
jgi:sialic acid synthase SpsE